jgi:hypothetical protein
MYVGYRGPRIESERVNAWRKRNRDSKSFTKTTRPKGHTYKAQETQHNRRLPIEMRSATNSAQLTNQKFEPPKFLTLKRHAAGHGLFGCELLTICIPTRELAKGDRSGYVCGPEAVAVQRKQLKGFVS